MTFISKIMGKKKAEDLKKDEIKKEYDIFIGRPQMNVFLKLYYIIVKNIHLLIRSKFSALVFLLGPLLVIFLVALAFNTSTLFDLNVAVYSDSYSTISDGIVENLSDNLYNVIRLNSEQDCIDAVKFQDFQVCLIFPPNMVLDNSANNVVKIYVDNSRLNIAHLISSQITTKVNVESAELSTELVTEILTILDTVEGEADQALPEVATLLSTNSQLRGSVSGISNDIGEIELSSDSVDTAAIDNEISDVKSNLNASSSAFKDLEDLIDGLAVSYSDAVTKLQSAESNLNTINSGITDTISSIDTDRNVLESIDTRLNVITDSADTVKITNVASIVSPIRTQIEPISSSGNFLLFILPTILVVLIMFVALLLSSASIIQEKTSQAYFRNYITPTHGSLFLIGELISNFIIIAVQVVLIMIILYTFLSDLGWQPFLLAGFVLLLIAIFFIILGMLIGYLFNTKQTVTLAALTTGLILLLFSNTLIPLETLSSVTRNIVFYNPFIMGESILKKIFLFNAGFPEIAPLVYILVGFSIALLLGVILARHFTKQTFNIQ